MRQWPAVLVVVSMIAIGPSAYAIPASVLVSGNTSMVIVDGNGDGPGPGDCVFTATVDPPSFSFTTFASSSTQDTTTAVTGCGGTAMGTTIMGQDSSSDFAFTSITSASNPAPSGMPWPLTGLFHAPVGVDVYEEFFAGVPDGFPMAPNTIEVQEGDSDPHVTMTLCSAGDPVVQVSVGGVPLLIRLGFHPENAVTPTHLTIPSIPLEKVGGGVALLNAFIPVTSSRSITVAFANEPSNLLVDLPLAQLPPCGRSAPTLTEWGLLIAFAGLFVAGTWLLHRRSFSTPSSA
jgi:hypothetical protein